MYSLTQIKIDKCVKMVIFLVEWMEYKAELWMKGEESCAMILYEEFG